MKQKRKYLLVIIFVLAGFGTLLILSGKIFTSYQSHKSQKENELDVFYQWYYGDLQRGTYRVTYPIKTEKNGNEELEGYFYTTFRISK